MTSTIIKSGSTNVKEEVGIWYIVKMEMAIWVIYLIWTENWHCIFSKSPQAIMSFFMIFQMAMLEPKLSILDETDSGLDVDAMRIVADGVNRMHTDKTSTIVITHYERLLEMIKPDVVHVLYKGRIVKTAGPELAKEIETRGYDWIKAEVDE